MAEEFSTVHRPDLPNEGSCYNCGYLCRYEPIFDNRGYAVISANDRQTGAHYFGQGVGP